MGSINFPWEWERHRSLFSHEIGHTLGPAFHDDDFYMKTRGYDKLIMWSEITSEANIWSPKVRQAINDQDHSCLQRNTGRHCYDGGIKREDGWSGFCADGCNQCSCRGGQLFYSTKIICPKKCIYHRNEWACKNARNCEWTRGWGSDGESFQCLNCILKNIAYLGRSIVKGQRNIQPSISACIKSCKFYLQCKFWTYHHRTKQCALFEKSKGTVRRLNGYYSGPRDCDPVGSEISYCGPKDCNILCDEDEQCKMNKNILCVMWPCCSRWSCKGKINICPAVYDPVCGKNGRTYKNTCEAGGKNKVQCQGKCPCRKESCGPAECNFSCPKEKQCVYGKFCKCAMPPCCGCFSCEEKDRSCPEIYRPVCGKDGVTYSNACKAGKDNIQCKGKCPCKNGCPYGWSFYGSSCYQVQHTKQSWYNAEYHCQRRGAHLASIHSLDESLFVAGLDPGAMWLGGTDRNHEGHWVWSDGTPFTFTGWSWTKPDNTGGQDCLVTNFRQFPGGWDDVQCRAMKKFVCEKQNLKMYQGTKFL